MTQKSDGALALEALRLPSRSERHDGSWAALLDAASEPYRVAGRFAYFFARGKLRTDPVFRTLLRAGLLAGRSQVLDLGCGQGLLAAWMQAASTCHARGAWPRGWPPPPQLQSIRGIELMARDVARARQALGARLQVQHGDLREVPFGHADAIVVLDVLHYLAPDCQLEVLRRIHAALPRGGVLLLRVGDAHHGLRFRITQAADRLILLARGHGWVKTHCRSLDAWRAVLDQCGFDGTAVWMSQGTPFANVLLIGRAR